VYFIDATANTLLGSVNLSGTNQVSYTTTSAQLTTLGSHTIEAVFATNSPYTNSPLSNTVTQTVTRAITDTTVTAASPAPSVYGQAVTFAAVVTARTGSPLPTNGALMLFFIDGAYVGNAATPISTSGPTAVYAFTTTATQLGAGGHSIQAFWVSPADAGAGSGGTNAYFKSSTALSPSFNQTVNPAPTTTLLASSPLYWAIGVPVTFYALVTSSGPGSPGVPTGSVTFLVDSVPTSKALDHVAGAYAYTTFTVTFNAPIASHTVGLTYNQSPASPLVPNYAASNAANQVQNVRNATSISLTATATTQTSGSALTILAGFSMIGNPPGTVVFTDTSTSLTYNGVFAGTSNGITYFYVTVNGGGAPLSVGTHVLTAHYNGDAAFDPTDASITLTIN
jgi:large repetitive protein